MFWGENVRLEDTRCVHSAGEISRLGDAKNEKLKVTAGRKATKPYIEKEPDDHEA